ncbi:MAG: peptidase G2 autoproteolytic cleavage domain-containing protein [Patescibacteria group bacterium]
MNFKSKQNAFSLIELLIYVAIFSIVAGLMTGILTMVLKVNQKESASAEATSQLNFVMQTIGRLVRESSNIEMATSTATSTLKLRMKDSAGLSANRDPIVIWLDEPSKLIKMSEGTGTYQRISDLTDNKIIADKLLFTKFSQYPGHDTVSIDIQLTYNSTNPNSRITRALQSAIARVSAATFDSPLLPGSDNTYDLGYSPNTRWRNAAFSGDLIVTGNIGIGTTAPSAKMEISGNSDATQFIVRANSTQSNTNPLIKLLKSDGTNLISIHSDDISNLFIGNNAGRVNSASGGGRYNVFIGMDTGYSNTTGYSNNAIGINALQLNTTGNMNNAMGMGALQNNLTGVNNNAIGYRALYSNTTGGWNNAVGVNSLYSNTTGGQNNAFGYGALFANTTASDNSAFGSYALYANTGYSNSAFGSRALNNNSTGYQNSAFGQNTLISNTTGANNAAFGRSTLYYNQTGSGNSVLGNNALSYNTTGNDNVVVGIQAGWGGVSGNSFSNNTILGSYAGRLLTTGSNNILLGYSAGDAVTSGSNNIIIGYNLDAPSATANNQLYIGGVIYGDLSTGNVGIGTTGPGAKLEVVNNVFPVARFSNTNTGVGQEGVYMSVAGTSASILSLYSGNFSDREFFFNDTGTGQADGAFGGGGADYAEYFENLNEEVIEKGTIVALENGKIKIAEKGDDFIVGAISTFAGITGNNGDIEEERWKHPEKWTLVALMGQVPVKVKGIINHGDYIELDDNGIGKKAEKWHSGIIGRSMEDYGSENIGKVKILIK